MSTDDLKYLHEQLSKQIDTEFDLLGHRMTWLLLSNSFLFTAISITASNLERVAETRLILYAVLVSVPLIGVLVCLSTYSSMLAARSVITEWKTKRETIGNAVVEKNELCRGSHGWNHYKRIRASNRQFAL